MLIHCRKECDSKYCPHLYPIDIDHLKESLSIKNLIKNKFSHNDNYVFQYFWETVSCHGSIKVWKDI